jgi:predicted signal transduction protein with EAL and GGDEF domain
VTVSCGVATLSDVHARSPEELLGYADAALYRAKARGRDRTEVAELVLDEQGRRLPPPAPVTQKMPATP